MSETKNVLNMGGIEINETLTIDLQIDFERRNGTSIATADWSKITTIINFIISSNHEAGGRVTQKEVKNVLQNELNEHGNLDHFAEVFSQIKANSNV